MLSRMDDERIFRDSNDLVFSAGTTRATRRLREKEALYRLLATSSACDHKQSLREAAASDPQEDSDSDKSSDSRASESGAEGEDEKEDLRRRRHLLHRHKRVPLHHSSPLGASRGVSSSLRRAKRVLQQANSSALSAPIASTSTLRKNPIKTVASTSPGIELVYLPSGEICARDQFTPSTASRLLPPPSRVPQHKENETPQAISREDYGKLRIDTAPADLMSGSHLPLRSSHRSHPHQSHAQQRRQLAEQTLQLSSDDSVTPNRLNPSPFSEFSGVSFRSSRTLQRQTNDEADSDSMAAFSTSTALHGKGKTTVDKSSSPIVEQQPEETTGKQHRYEDPSPRTEQSLLRESQHQNQGRDPPLHSPPRSPRSTQPARSLAKSPIPPPSLTPLEPMDERVQLLDHELQTEKQRLLQKMTQLLEEQDKNQRLQQEVVELRTKLSSQLQAQSHQQKTFQFEVESLRQEMEHNLKTSVQAMEENLQVKDTIQKHLESEKQALEQRVLRLEAQVRKTPSERPRDHNEYDEVPEQKEGVQIHRDDRVDASDDRLLGQELVTFLTQVAQWKQNSDELLECLLQPRDRGVLESIWIDFPVLPDMICQMYPQVARFKKLESRASTTSTSHSDESSVAATASTRTGLVDFLKKRVVALEQDLRQTQARYIELKELCARQCVREADLQNFVNEHRLRGNLIIRNEPSTLGVGASGSASAPSVATVTPSNGRNGSSSRSTTTASHPAERVRFQVDSDSINRHPTGATGISTSASASDSNKETKGTNTPFDPFLRVKIGLNGSTSGAEEDEEGASSDQEEHDENKVDNANYLSPIPVRRPKVILERRTPLEVIKSSSSAVLRKIEEAQRSRKGAVDRHIDRVKLIPSSTFSRQHERVPTPKRTTTRSTTNRKVSTRKSVTSVNSGPRHGTTTPSSAKTGANRRTTSRTAYGSSATATSTAAISSAQLKKTSKRQPSSSMIRPWI